MGSTAMNQNDQQGRALGTLLAGAVGDALGWPQEQNAGNVSRQQGRVPSPELEFRAWTRYSGGRFYPHHERIGPGEYSDDTQLVLATARSLLHGADWHHWLTAVELPLLPLYERGAGRALKRASASWLRDRPPWMAAKRDAVVAYFNAGGNGAAMRVAPHCLRVAERGVQAILVDVLRDAICTHGHPRALLGASLQAYAVTSLLQRQETLGYGELIDEVLSAVDLWGNPDLIEELPEDWKQGFERRVGEPPQELWTMTVGEMVDLLKVVAKGLGTGTLGDDEATLAALGCFDKAVNGAGTVSAAASLYLASKSAPNPAAGLLSAAFLRDADSDTIASMTGSLLGALRGVDWIGDLGQSVQDADYFTSIVESIMGGATQAPEEFPDRITQGLLERFIAELEEADADGEVWAGSLPDGRAASVVAPLPADPLSPKFEIRGWILAVADGQSIFAKKLKRVEHPQRPSATEVKVARLGVKVLSSDLQVSRHFYEQVLGLEPAREENNLVNYGEVLTIVRRPRDRPGARQLGFEDVDAPVIVFLELAPIVEVYERVKRAGGVMIAPLGGHDRRFFRCTDPDGTVLEIREAR